MRKPRRVGLGDIARDAGVSAATVSRAISQPELLTAATLARVKASAERLGYRSKEAERALAMRRFQTIGAIVPTLDSAIFARALQSMQIALAQKGFLLLVASHESSAGAETQAARALIERGVDGLMLVGAERAPETTALLKEAGVPVLTTWCGSNDFPSVTIDNVLAGRLAAEHLIALGHRRIGMITGHLNFNDRQNARLAGARAALEDAGLRLPDQLVSEQALTVAGGRMGCAALFELSDVPTAVIGGIDLFAIGCLEEAHSRGIDVPGSMSVVGIDGLEMSAHLSPSLTTVQVPTSLIGRSAATKLIDLIASRAAEHETRLPVELVVRRSSGRP